MKNHLTHLLLAFTTLLAAPSALAAPPANDNYGNAINLGNTLPLNTVGTNVEATVEAGEFPSGNERTVWYRWTAAAGGFVDIRTEGADFDTKLAVFSATPGLPGSTDLIGADDDSGVGVTSLVVVPVQTGQVIAIRIGGYNGASGSFPLALTVAPTPYNNYASRLILPGTPTTRVDVANVGASVEAGEHLFTGNIQATLWFSWTAPSTGSFRADTLEGKMVDTTLAVYSDTGSLPVAASLIGSNDDVAVPQLGSQVVFAATAGNTYAFQVGGFSSARGSFTLTIAPNVPRPGNDYYANRTVLGNTAPVTTTGNNTAGTLERDESIPVPGMRASVWYSWIAPASGHYQFDTLTGPSLDTVLAVYTTSPGPPSAAARLGFEDDGPGTVRSRVIVLVTAGQTYTVQVGTVANARGSFTLRIAQAQPADIALAITGGADRVNGESVFVNGALGFASQFRLTLRNEGDVDLTGVTLSLSGLNAAEFSFTHVPPSVLRGKSSEDFTVTCTPASLATRTAILSIVSSDPDESPIAINLGCYAFSDSEDSDGDGLSDGAEVRLAGLGFDLESPQYDLVAILMTGANGAGLFTQDQIQGMHAGAQFSARDPQTGRFVLKISLKKSTDLTNYTDFPFIPAGTSVDAAGNIRFEFDAPGNAALLKLGIE